MLRKIGSVFSIFILGFIAISIITWPLVTQLSTHLNEQSDLVFYHYLLSSNWQSILNLEIFDWSSYLQGKQFFPWPLTKVYSDLMLLPMLVYGPIVWATQNPVLALNLTGFIFLCLNLVSMYLVAQGFLKNRWAAWLAGLIYAFNTPQLAHYIGGHWQLTMRFFLPPLLWFGYSFITKPSYKQALWLMVFFVLNSLTNVYFLAYGIVLISVIVLIFLYQNRAKWRSYLLVRLSYFWVFLPSLGFLYAYYWPWQRFFKFEGVTRNLIEVVSFSARTIDYVTPDVHSWLYYWWYAFLLRWRSVEAVKAGLVENSLWLQIVPILFLISGLVYLRKYWRQVGWIAYLLIIALVLGFGPYWQNNFTGLPLPYLWLYKYVFFIQSMRVPARFIFLALVPFSLVAGYGVLWWQKKTRGRLWLIILIASLLIIAENRTLGFAAVGKKSLYPVVQKLVKKGDLGFLNDQPTVHLPIWVSAKTDYFTYLSWISATQEKSFNGYSGYYPGDWTSIQKELDKQFTDKELMILKTLGYRYLIVHWDYFGPSQKELRKTQLKQIDQSLVWQKQNISIYDLKKVAAPLRICSDLKLKVIFNKKWQTTTGIMGDINIQNLRNCYLNLSNRSFAKYHLLISNSFRQEQISQEIRLPMMLRPKEIISLPVNLTFGNNGWPVQIEASLTWLKK